MTAKKEISNADYLVNAYLTGESITKILKDNGISECLFYRVLRDNGVKRRTRAESYKIRDARPKPDITIVDNTEICNAYISGESENLIAKRFKVSRDTVKKRLRDAGIVRRSKSDAEILKWEKIKQSPELIDRQCGAAWLASRAIDDELEKTVITSYRAGKSIVEIASENNCSSSNIKRIMRKNELFDNTTPQRRARGRGFTGAREIMSPFEIPLFDAFNACGLNPVQQFAINTCNVDFAFPQVRVVVELERGYICNSHSLRRERIKNIIGAGWRVFIVYNPRKLDISYIDVANQTASFLEAVGTNPSIIGQYGVVGCDGKPFPRFSNNLYGFTRIEGF